MDVSKRVGAGTRHRAKEAHASSQSAGLPEATGAQRAWEGTCFSGAATISVTVVLVFTAHFGFQKRRILVPPFPLFPEAQSLLAQDGVRKPRWCSLARELAAQAWLAST